MKDQEFTGCLIPEPLSRYRGISIGAKLTYGRLVQCAGISGIARLTVGTLADELGVSINQARRYLRELAVKGFLEIGRDAGRENSYRFLWHAAFEGDRGTIREPIEAAS